MKPTNFEFSKILIIVCLSFLTPVAGATFSAADFLNPRSPYQRLPANWPERLTFEKLDSSPEAVEQWLIGAWKILYSCSGRALSSDQTVALGIDQDTASKLMVYTNDGFYQLLLPTKPMEKAVFQTDLRPFYIYPDATPDRVDVYETALGLAAYQIVKVRETGETALRDRSQVRQKNFEYLCRPGEIFEILQVRVPTS